METLELRHLAPYLPYGLKVLEVTDTIPIILVGIGKDRTGQIFCEVEDIRCPENIYINIKDITPILRPMSDYNKVFLEKRLGNTLFDLLVIRATDFATHKSAIEGFFKGFLERKYMMVELPYHLLLLLFKHHFDVFGLIDKGLAVDMNTIT